MARDVISQPFKVGAFKIEPFVLQIGTQQPGFALFALFEGESAEPLAVCATEPQAVSLAERLGACSDLAQARADLEAAQASAAIRQTTIDEAHLVLDGADIDRESADGHTLPLWDRIADLMYYVRTVESERDAARAGRGPE